MKALPEIERRPASKELALQKKVNDAKEFAKKIDWGQLNDVMNTNYPIPKK